jgi:hypothetical protein
MIGTKWVFKNKHREDGEVVRNMARLKTTMTVSWFGPQNQDRQFDDLGPKITVMISWFRPQNHVGGGLLVCASKPMRG